jgi:cyanate permease
MLIALTTLQTKSLEMWFSEFRFEYYIMLAVFCAATYASGAIITNVAHFKQPESFDDWTKALDSTLTWMGVAVIAMTLWIVYSHNRFKKRRNVTVRQRILQSDLASTKRRQLLNNEQ